MVKHEQIEASELIDYDDNMDSAASALEILLIWAVLRTEPRLGTLLRSMRTRMRRGMF